MARAVLARTILACTDGTGAIDGTGDIGMHEWHGRYWHACMARAILARMHGTGDMLVVVVGMVVKKQNKTKNRRKNKVYNKRNVTPNKSKTRSIKESARQPNVQHKDETWDKRNA